MRKTIQRITPFLWFDDQAEEAVNFYVSIFDNSRIAGLARYDEEAARAAGRPKGAISFVVNCETRKRSTISGSGCPPAASTYNAAVSKTGSVFRGKSFPLSWARCCRTRTPRSRNE